MDNIKKLRELTGAGFLDCKKALDENKNEIEKSIIYLRKKGLAKASEKFSRETKEGAIGVFLNTSKALMIEINSETDFAAKNDVFLNFFDKIGKFALTITDLNMLNPKDFLNNIFEGKKIQDHFNEIIAIIGENIVLKRLFSISIDSKSSVYTYTHNTYRPNIGKICVILKAEVNCNNEETNQFGKNLCMHIAASKPIAMDIDDLEVSLIDQEKDIQLASIKSSGKPENIIKKILEGKMNKFFSEVTLLNQNYILDTNKNIKTVLSEFSTKNFFNISQFKLFVLGS